MQKKTLVTSFLINAVGKSTIGYNIFSFNFIWNKLGNYNWETKDGWTLFTAMERKMKVFWNKFWKNILEILKKDLVKKLNDSKCLPFFLFHSSEKFFFCLSHCYRILGFDDLSTSCMSFVCLFHLVFARLL